MPIGPLVILLFATLILALGVLTVVSLGTEPVADAEETVEGPAGDHPNALKTMPWTRGVDPSLPHTLVVGVDIEPGTYSTQGRGSAENPGLECTWARLRGLSGRSSDVIVSGRGWGQATVTILATDKGFVTGGCSEWIGPVDRPSG